MKRLENLPVFLLITVALCVSYFLLPDYGMGWDEPDIYRYGAYALDAYQYILHPQNLPPFDTNLNFYGPAYFMLATLFTRSAADQVSAWHLANFITFLGGIYFIYALSGRWMSGWAAFGVAFLFLTQPLLWGHAFINQKDTPFMTFFLGSVFLGLEMVDAPPRGYKQWILIFVSGILLGLTSSIRILGPLAGIFVVIYAIAKYKNSALHSIAAYSLIGLASFYLTWPYLWKSPIANFIESLKVMAQFPFEGGRVLFWGEIYPLAEVPRSYFPTLFVLQMTEPALILLVVGLIVMVASRKWESTLLFAGWFILPASAILITHSILYDNARQLYFLMPPLFWASGFAFDFIFDAIAKIELNWLHAAVPKILIKSAVIAAAILPGVVSIKQLHPYEYAYYNSMVGGVAGAYGRQETDYWGISFKQSMEYINLNAPKNARILILSGPYEVARYYARPDLYISEKEDQPYDYVLILTRLTRKNQTGNRCNQADIAQIVGRGDAVFTYIKKFKTTALCD